MVQNKTAALTSLIPGAVMLTLWSVAAASCGQNPQGIMALVQGFSGVAVGLISNLVASDLQPHWNQIRKRLLGKPQGKSLASAALTQAVGRAMAAVITLAAQEPQYARYKNELAKLAKDTAQTWEALAKDENIQNDFWQLMDANLPDVLITATPRFNKDRNLDTTQEANLLDVSVNSREGQEALLSEEEWATILLNIGAQIGGSRFFQDADARQSLAALLRTAFPHALREVLKEDFATNGHSYAELMLTLVPEIRAITQKQLESSLEQEQTLTKILERLNSTERQLHSRDPVEVHRVFRAISEHMVTGFDQVCQQLAVTETNITALLAGLESVLVRKLEDLKEEVAHLRDNSSDSQQLIMSIPLQRPTRVKPFVGRQQELTDLLSRLRLGGMVAICGLGGMGKSALIAEALWTLAPGDTPPELFPDGILLHSFDINDKVEVVLDGFVRAYGQEPEPNPVVAARRVLSNKKALLVLDGAEVADDIKAVLEVAGSCGVLVTSITRNHLSNIQQLQVFTREQSVELLQKLTPAQVGQDRAAAERVCELVGDLPLAVALVGRYLAETEMTVAEYLPWLEATPLTALNQGQRRDESVPVLLERTISRLSEQARLVLGITGLLAFTPFKPMVVAMGMAKSQEEAAVTQALHTSRPLLAELVRWGLLQRQDGDFVASHRLIHTYAREKLSPPLPIVKQLISLYHTQFNNLQVDQSEDLQTLHYERPHALALLRSCETFECWEQVFSLADSLSEYLDLQGYWHDWLDVAGRGCQAARQLKDRGAEARYLNYLGLAHRSLGQYEQALDHHQQYLIISRDMGDRQRVSNALGNLCTAYSSMGQYPQAIVCCREALTNFREIGDRQGEGNALGNLSIICCSLGQYIQASDYALQHLAIARKIGDREEESNALGSLGNAHLCLCQYKQAICCYERQLTIAGEIGYRRGEGNALGSLGTIFYSLGNYSQAIDYYQQSLTIVQKMRNRQGEGELSWNLGLAYKCLREYSQAAKFIEVCVACKQEIDHPDAQACLKELEEVRRLAEEQGGSN